MIPHKEAQEILERAVRHLGRKMDLDDECPDCGCSPITANEIAILFKYLSSEGVVGVEDEAPLAAPKPTGTAAFPVKKANGTGA